MNTSEYIESGIIETYVLGMASPEEAAELEALCLEFPEIKAALNAFEETLEKNEYGYRHWHYRWGAEKDS